MRPGDAAEVVGMARELAAAVGDPEPIEIIDYAGRVATNTEPLALLDSALGPLASADTRETILRAESRAQALTLLVMSPEFLRS